MSDKNLPELASGHTTPSAHNAPDSIKLHIRADVETDRLWRNSNMEAARDFRVRMAAAWRDAEWPGA